MTHPISHPHSQGTTRLEKLKSDLFIVSWGMVRGTDAGPNFRWSITRDCAHTPDAVSVLEDPGSRAAFLRCVFTVPEGISDDFDLIRISWFLHEWLPETAPYTITRHTTANELADMLLDPNWRAICAIDFDSLSNGDLDAVLLTHPPLRGQPLLTTAPSAVDTTLPDNLDNPSSP